MTTPVALAVYAVLLAIAAAAVWRRPVVALYLWIVGVAVHNSVGAALYGAGVRDSAAHTRRRRELARRCARRQAQPCSGRRVLPRPLGDRAAPATRVGRVDA